MGSAIERLPLNTAQRQVQSLVLRSKLVEREY